jgi:hypothetical protein
MLTGRVNLEKVPAALATASKCSPMPPLQLAEVLVQAQRNDPRTKTTGTRNSDLSAPAPPNAKGEFFLRSLDAGGYRLITKLPDAGWYVRGITLSTPNIPPPTRNAPKFSDIGRNGFTLKAGEKLTGVILTLAEGAASFEGKVSSPGKPTQNFAQLKVHLVPAEDSQADEIIRYAETAVEQVGSFAFKNLAPGKYWILARPATDNDSMNQPQNWNSLERTNLRRAAETVNQLIELKTCQQVKDYQLPTK